MSVMKGGRLGELIVFFLVLSSLSFGATESSDLNGFSGPKT